jgi:hypothetical protein
MCFFKEDLERLTIIAGLYAINKPPTNDPPRGPTVDSLWLDRVIYVLTAMAHATRREYLEVDLPSKPIAGTPFRTVPITVHYALAEGREGIIGLVGGGESFVFTTLTTSFRTFVTEDSMNSSALVRTLQLAQELTSLRRQALRRRILLETQVS